MYQEWFCYPHQKFPEITVEKNPKYNRKFSTVLSTYYECTTEIQSKCSQLFRKTVRKKAFNFEIFFDQILLRIIVFGVPRLQSIIIPFTIMKFSDFFNSQNTTDESSWLLEFSSRIIHVTVKKKLNIVFLRNFNKNEIQNIQS